MMEQFRIGDSHTLTFGFSLEKVISFADVCGDHNPIHIDPEFAATTRFKKPVAHGMFGASLISAVLGQHMPGQGTIYMDQELHFRAPIYVDDEVAVTCSITDIDDRNRARISTVVRRLSDDKLLVDGEAVVLLPVR